MDLVLNLAGRKTLKIPEVHLLVKDFYNYCTTQCNETGLSLHNPVIASKLGILWILNNPSHLTTNDHLDQQLAGLRYRAGKRANKELFFFYIHAAVARRWLMQNQLRIVLVSGIVKRGGRRVAKNTSS